MTTIAETANPSAEGPGQAPGATARGSPAEPLREVG